MSSKFTIANFKFGLDGRRSELTSLPGTLQQALDCHVNQGAQIEKRKAFVQLGQLPNGCFGLQETTNNGLVTYGSAAPPLIPAGLTGLVSYQRIRHPYWQLDGIAPQIIAHLNPNGLVEPALSGIVHSCAFGGFDFAIASYTAEEGTGLDTFDDLFSGTFYYYNGKVLINCLQGRLDFMNTLSNNDIIGNQHFCNLFNYFATQLIGTSFTFTSGSVGVPAECVNITGPIASAFSLVVSDTSGQITTSTIAVAAPPITGVGATTTFYLTKGSGGSINSMTGPNGSGGTVNLISAAVNYSISLFQTATNLINAINAGASGYTGQVNYTSTNIVGITITAPVSFGDTTNTQNILINTTTIFTSLIALVNSGAAGGQNFAMAGGVTTTAGQGQVQQVQFNTQTDFGSSNYGYGNYQADLVYNTLTYNLGRANLTTQRASCLFYLTSGASGSVNSITTPQGLNLLGGVVNFDTSLVQTCKDLVSTIAGQFNATVNQWRYSSGGGSPVLRNENTWFTYPVETANSNGDLVPGIMIVAPVGEQYNGMVLTVNCTTIKVSSGPNLVGQTTLSPTLLGAVIDGSYVMGLGGKLYMARGSQFNFSASYDCTKWNRQDTGAGFIQNVDQYASPSATTAFAPFQGKLAVFSRNNVVIWVYNADPAQYSQFQSLPNIGTMAKLSVQPLGDLDVLFLHDSGVRSLRVREATLNAMVNDIGSPIDDFIQASLVGGSASSNAAACSIVDPSTGRYWLYLNRVIYVLSYFPSVKIVAWSTYSPTYLTDMGAPNTGMFTYNGLTIGRKYFWTQGNASTLRDSGNTLIFPGGYGNANDNSFIAQTTSVTVTTSTLDGNAPPYTSDLIEQTPFVPVKFLIYLGQIYVLDSNNYVYVYGGANNNTYDGTPAYVKSPWMDLKEPNLEKNAVGIQASLTGDWILAASMDPYANDLEVVKPSTGNADGQENNDSTFDQGSYGFDRIGTHLQFEAFTNFTWTQAATFSSFVLRYNPGAEV